MNAEKAMDGIQLKPGLIRIDREIRFVAASHSSALKQEARRSAPKC